MTPDWPAIEAAYRDSDLTVAEIIVLFHVTQDQLYRRAHREGWPPRRKRLPVGREVYGHAARSDDPSVAMLARLTGTLHKNIDELEYAVENPNRTTADRERDAKLLSTLAQVLDKLMALSERISQATPPDRDTAADHDRIVAAIAERVARLTAARSQGGLPPQPDGAGS
ncbi:hypothetical protein [Pyruvatibacter mobilis]|uniref:hypothetical protein n=1 Tax=Pyruvatibacter mobilis TaxID=1712261 RepID=UPI003BB03630